MANRNMLAKMLKKKRRGRYARFSGATSKTLTKTVEVLEHKGEDSTTLKRVEVYVGLVSLSKQVPKGFGPNHERMAEYYGRVRSLSEKTLADSLEIKDERYKQVWMETPVTNRVNLLNDNSARLDLYWHGTRWFFVLLNYDNKTITRSRDYGSRRFAMDKLEHKNITWVEQFPMSSVAT